MEKKGHFILCNVDEFESWLNDSRIARTIRLIQNHHTYIPNYSHFKGNNHFAMLQGMEQSHLQRGFSEIAQNLTTFPDGKVAICRSFEKIPAGIKGANQAGICMEHIGNFDTGGDNMRQEHRDAILKVNALLLKKFSLPANTDTVVYHHWWDLNSGLRGNGSGSTKSCPGTNFFGGNSVDAATRNFISVIDALLKGVEKAPPFLRECEVTAGTLNVRNAPSVSGSLLKQLNQGIRVMVYEDQAEWCRIHPTQQHWVSGRYLRASMGG